MTDQRCGTCRHYEDYQVVAPPPWGICGWVPTAPIPWWVHPGKSIYPTEGTDCPTWEAATPAPIRRRFTMNTIENVTIAKMGGAIVVGSSGGHPSSSLAMCVSWLCFDDERWVDVEMKSGHHLTTYGEATDE